MSGDEDLERRIATLEQVVAAQARERVSVSMPHGGDYGLVADGALAPIRLEGGSALSPHVDTHAHVPGELALQLTGSGPILWFCVKPGTPGEWRKVAVPETAATFTPSGPQRLYDSRTSDGPLASGQTRVVNLGWFS